MHGCNSRNYDGGKRLRGLDLAVQPSSSMLLKSLQHLRHICVLCYIMQYDAQPTHFFTNNTDSAQNARSRRPRSSQRAPRTAASTSLSVLRRVRTCSAKEPPVAPRCSQQRSHTSSQQPSRQPRQAAYFAPRQSSAQRSGSGAMLTRTATTSKSRASKRIARESK